MAIDIEEDEDEEMVDSGSGSSMDDVTSLFASMRIVACPADDAMEIDIEEDEAMEDRAVASSIEHVVSLLVSMQISSPDDDAMDIDAQEDEEMLDMEDGPNSFQPLQPEQQLETQVEAVIANSQDEPPTSVTLPLPLPLQGTNQSRTMLFIAEAMEIDWKEHEPQQSRLPRFCNVPGGKKRRLLSDLSSMELRQNETQEVAQVDLNQDEVDQEAVALQEEVDQAAVDQEVAELDLSHQEATDQEEVVLEEEEEEGDQEAVDAIVQDDENDGEETVHHALPTQSLPRLPSPQQAYTSHNCSVFFYRLKGGKRRRVSLGSLSSDATNVDDATAVVVPERLPPGLQQDDIEGREEDDSIEWPLLGEAPQDELFPEEQQQDEDQVLEERVVLDATHQEEEAALVRRSFRLSKCNVCADALGSFFVAKDAVGSIQLQGRRRSARLMALAMN